MLYLPLTGRPKLLDLYPFSKLRVVFGCELTKHALAWIVACYPGL